MEKNGMLTEDSFSDFGNEKVAFVDESSPLVAGPSHKDKLAKPMEIKKLTQALKQETKI